MIKFLNKLIIDIELNSSITIDEVDLGNHFAFFLSKCSGGHSEGINYNRNEMLDMVGKFKYVAAKRFMFKLLNLDIALKLCDQSINFHKFTQNKERQASSLNLKGSIYKLKKEYETALEYYTPAYEIRKEINDELKIDDSLNNIANTNFELGRYDNAIETFKEALKLSENQDDKSKMATIIGNIGIAYIRLEMIGPALDYYQQCVDMKNYLGENSTLLKNMEEELSKLFVEYYGNDEFAKHKEACIHLLVNMSKMSREYWEHAIIELVEKGW